DVEGHGLPFSVRADVTEADARTRSLECRRIGYPPFAAEESPGPHERADGDVERAAPRPAVLERRPDQREELPIDGHRPRRTVAVQPREPAVGPIVREKPIEPIDLVERALERGRRLASFRRP